MAKIDSLVAKFFSDEGSKITGKDVAITLEIVDLNNLQRYPSFQRDIRPDRVSQIKDNFSPFIAGVWHVAEVNGDYILCDENHRCETAVELQFTHWPCLVMHGSDIKECAKLWKLLQTRWMPTALERFNAALVEGNKTAVSIRRIVHESGFRFADELGEAPVIKAIGALYFANDRRNLPKVLQVARIWCPLNGVSELPSTRGDVLKGISLFWEAVLESEDRDRFCQKHFERRLKNEDVEVFYRRAQGTRGDCAVRLARQLFAMYNDKTPKARRVSSSL